MAKTAKIKKASTANPRSRASKRASSPSINIDKSIRDAPRASDATPILSARPNTGITKSTKKQKNLTRGQRRRHQKGVARAEVVHDRLTKKADDASSRLKKRRERKGMWDEVNGTTNFDKLKAVMGENMDEKDGDEWVDDAMEEVEDGMVDRNAEDGVDIPVTASETKLLVVGRPAPPPTIEEEDDADKIT